jgi:RNA polymerase sigma-70 factor (ECF subfamily)
MHTTSASLLDRLRQPTPREAWEQFVRLYTPFLFYVARRLGLQSQDAEDLVQTVFMKLLKELPKFNYDQHGSFRTWLRVVTLNVWRNGQRRHTLPLQEGSDASLSELAYPDGTEAFAETEYQQYLAARALEFLKTEFEPTTWKAFWECAVCKRSGDEVAVDLHMSRGAVYAAKGRVLQRLREEFGGLLE